MNKDKAVCQNNTVTMVETLESLGFTINYKKSSLIPSQRIVFFGFVIDIIEFKIFLTEEKVSKILLKANNLTNKSFSYQDTPPLHSFLVCILNFDKTSKIFSKCNHLFGRYLGETHFVHKSRAVTQLKNKEKQNVIG